MPNTREHSDASLLRWQVSQVLLGNGVQSYGSCSPRWCLQSHLCRFTDLEIDPVKPITFIKLIQIR
uniref:Uncharacterized protein n=1 Tax=Anguilla anguilla TaxID=7936 RepID=A0A0E9W8Z3_ANGAN